MAVNALTDESFIVPILINRRCIQVSDANFDRTAHRCRGFLIIALAVPAHQAHTPQTDSRNLFAGIPQCSLLQIGTPFFWIYYAG
jgi:hypothetical protein